MSLSFQQEQETRLISLKGQPLPTSPTQQPQQRRSLFRVLGEIVGWCRRYTAEDLARIKEAGVAQLEANAFNRRAEGEVKVAQAAERHAHAHLLKAQAASVRSQAQVANATATTEMFGTYSNYLRSVADDLERVADAISRIKQLGGEVAFDSAQLLALLAQGDREFPNDEVIQQALEHAMSPPSDE